MHKRWEYKIIQPSTEGVGLTLSMKKYSDAIETQINRLGMDGWECFAIESGSYHFKRQR